MTEATLLNDCGPYPAIAILEGGDDDPTNDDGKLTYAEWRGMLAVQGAAALGEAVGHLGATYGFQSQLVYFPALKFAMAVATNIETPHQSQPKDALCFAYNAVAALL